MLSCDVRESSSLIWHDAISGHGEGSMSFASQIRRMA